MKKILLILYLLLSLYPYSVNLKAQWKQVDIVTTGYKINSLTVSGSNVIAGNESGIKRSTDFGSNWPIVNSSFTLCFASSGSIIYAGTSSGVILSTDNGNSWSTFKSNLPYYISALAVNNTSIFAGTNQNGIFRSTDNGNTWTSANNGQVIALAVNPNGTNGTTIYSGTSAGLYISNDNGNSWSNLVANNLSSLQVINCITVNGSTIFVGTPGGILRSIDNGNTWEIANTGINFDTGIFSIIVNGSYTFAGTTAGAYMSTDNGTTWTAINTGLPVSPQVYSIAAGASRSGGTNLYAGTNDGVYVSSNYGLNWMGQNSTNFSTQLRSIIGSGSNIFVVMQGPLSQPMLVSKDYGAMWKPADDSGLTSIILNLILTGSTLYCTTNDGIFLSSNDGKNWTSINGGIMDNAYFWNIVQSGPNLVLSTLNQGVFFSSNNGAIWNSATGNAPNSPSSLNAFGSEIFSGSHEGMYYSSNNGENWSKLNDTLTDVESFASIGSTLFAARTAAYKYSVMDTTTPHPGGLYRSSDNGNTWMILNSIPPDSIEIPTLFVHNSDIFKWDLNRRKDVYLSTNKGESWSYLGDGLPDGAITGLFVNDSTIFVGVGSTYGIWKRRLSEITDVKQLSAPNIPASFRLWQNYPNPFNPTTTISYDIPERSHVMLNVYDVLGRNVETLINTEKEAGHYQITFKAGNLSSGVYFYRMESGSFNQTRKLLILK
jgi:photosystem II stability/assembly factor-like uncharacterized protein